MRFLVEGSVLPRAARMLTSTQGSFSDECSVQTSPETLGGWIFREPDAKFSKNNVNHVVHVKAEITRMVWGRIWKGGRLNLVIMRRDPLSKGKGYSSNSYIWALEEGLLPDYHPDCFFQQDNARIHTSRPVKEWMETHGIWVIDHPPKSPDMNPIEHVWKAMKAILRKDYPELATLKDNEENRAKVDKALQVAWWAVPQDLIDRLIDSMPRRVEALRKAKGWYTKY